MVIPLLANRLFRFFNVTAIVTASILVTTLGHAAEVTHKAGTGALSLATSWVGDVLPTGTQVGLLDTNIGATVALGTSSLSIGGLKLLNSSSVSITGGSNTLTLGSSGIDMSGAGANATYSAGTINLGAAQTWEVSSGRLLSLTGTNLLTGTGALTLKGSGTFAFLKSTGANTYSGGTIIDNTSVMYAGVIVTGSLFGTGNITIKGTNSFSRSVDSAQLQQFNNKFIFSGTQSSLTIGKDTTIRSYTSIRGGVDVNSGTHTIGLYSELDNRSSAAYSLALYGLITGSGNANSTLALTNKNSGTNEIFVRVISNTSVAPVAQVRDLTLSIGQNVRFSAQFANGYSNVAVVANGILDIGTWTATGGSSWDQTITALSGSGTATNSGVAPTLATLTIDGGVNTGTSVFTGVIQNGVSATVGPIALTKAGANTQVLTGANTYTGTTLVNGGKLIVNGAGTINNTAEVIVNGGAFIYDNDSVALNRNVTVTVGAFRQNSTQNYTGTLTFTSGTLGGSNLSGHDLAIGENQVLAPGNSTGELTAESANFQELGTLQVEINDATGQAGSTTLGWDLLTLANGLDITATIDTKFTIQVLSLNAGQQAGLALNFNPEFDYEWLIVDADLEITSFDALKFEIDAGGFLNNDFGDWAVVRGDSIGGDSSDLYLTYTIPEPSTWALLLSGGLVVLAQFRRRRA